MIETSLRGRCLEATLQRGKANAMNREFLTQLRGLLGRVSAGEAEALLITARGSIFSAGVDLPSVLASSDEDRGLFVGELRALFEELLAFEAPLVAAVNGHALAGGCVLALAADRRIGARGSWKMGVPELGVGVPFPAGVLELVRQAIPGAAEDLAFSGRSVGVEEARSLGLLHEVVEPEDLLARSRSAADFLISAGPAFRLAKRQLRAPAAERLARLGPEIDAEVDRLWRDPATLAGIQSYVDRTLKRSKP